MYRGETDVHFRLKLAAMQWLYRRGHGLVTCEYQLFGAGGATVDAFGVRDRKPYQSTVVEAKASRADFLKDFQPPGRMDERRAELEVEREAIEAEDAKLVERVKADPLLWKKEEFQAQKKDVWARRRRVYKGLSNERGWKGKAIPKIGNVTECYVITPKGMVKPEELDGWGLIEVDGQDVRKAVASPKYTLGGPLESDGKKAIDRHVKQIARRNTLNLFTVLGAVWVPAGPVLLKDDLYQGTLQEVVNATQDYEYGKKLKVRQRGR